MKKRLLLAITMLFSISLLGCESIIPREDAREFDEQKYIFYSNLNEEQRYAYGEIVTGIEAGSEEVKLAADIIGDDLEKINYAIQYDQVQLFWFENIGKYETVNDGVTRVFLEYNDLYEKRDEYADIIENETDTIVDGAKDLSDVEAEKYFHDTLCQNITYKDGRYDQNIYSALVEGETVCTGYAKAFSYLMMKRGIPCYLCQGTSYNRESEEDENHIWNLVEFDGEYYNVDVTWDDQYQEKDKPVNMISYEYFNVQDKNIDVDHTRNQQGKSLPACKGETYSLANAFGYSWKEAAMEYFDLTVSDMISDWDEYQEACYQTFVDEGLGTHTMKFLVDEETAMDDIEDGSDEGLWHDYVDRLVEYYGMYGWNFKSQYSSQQIGDGFYYVTQDITLENY